MIRGGDTPEKTLWKYLIPNSTAEGYVYGEVEGKDKLIIPKDKKLGNPVARNGIIAKFIIFDKKSIQYVINLLNEKGYNIPSSGWTERIISEKVGDPVPNWNEYEEL